VSNLLDVAKAAGVSPSTVSRVVREDPNVRASTRERVLEVMQELNYIPNALARGFKRSRSTFLSLIVADVTSPFFAAVARGAEDEARDAGYSLVLSNSDETSSLEALHLRAVGERRVGGVVVTPTEEAAKSIRRYLPEETPVVLLDSRVDIARAHTVTCDTETGVEQLVTHLRELRHERIALVGGLTQSANWQQRHAGYARAMGEQAESALVHPVGWSYEAGRTGGRLLLDGAHLPDAVIAANAQVCLGLLDELIGSGVSVPEDIGVAAVDDPFPESLFLPRLTVVNQPGYDMGRKAVEILVQHLEAEGDVVPLPQHIVFPSALRIGTSCGEAIPRRID